MAATVSYTSFDYKHVQMVPVIASFDTKGRIVPLYVRIEENVYRIESFYPKCKFSGIEEFHCELIDGNYRKPLLLTYYKNEDVWAIPVLKS